MMKNRTVWTGFLCLALCVFLFCGCSAPAKSTSDSLAKPYADVDGLNYSYKTSYADETLYVDGETPPAPFQPSERKIIRSVNETLETNHFDDCMAALDKAVAEIGGYFGSLRVSDNGYGESNKRRSASMTVYVPAENLSSFTDTVGTLGAVTQYVERANDVTEAYVDVTSRIAVLEAEEKSLLGMLESAKNVSDMLAVRSQLNSVQQDLASLRAQKSSYDKRVAYSTVEMYIYEVGYVSGTGTGKLPFFEEVGETFVNSLFGVLDFLREIGIVLFGGFPIIVLAGGIGCVIFFIVRGVRRKKEKKRLARQTENKE